MVQVTRILSVVAALSTIASALPTVQRRGQHPEVVVVHSSSSALPAEHKVTVTSAVHHEPTPAKHHTTSSSVKHEPSPPAKHEQTPPAHHTPPPAKHETTVVKGHETSSTTSHTPVHQTTVVHETSTTAHATVTAAPAEHTTSSVSHPVATVSYGSGSMNWNTEFNDCVQQCHAKFGVPAPSHTPTATTTVAHGTGATHTVIVAPSQGVLRYVPFAVNATVGDTIKFVWGANNHTVTKGSALLPCNRSTDPEGSFATGIQNKDFVFTQVVNDTKPTYFFCGAPTHCQKGMFGIINPVTNFDAATSVSRSIQSLASSNPDLAAYQAYTRTKTAGNAAAAGWGGNIDLGALPDWAQTLAAENVLYTRTFLASNPETWTEEGIDLSTATTTPLSIPLDAKAAIASTPSTAAETPATTATGSAETGSASPVSGLGTSGNLSSSASSSASPRFLVAAAAVFATFFLL